MKMLEPQWTRVLESGLESAADPKMVELHPDLDAESSSGSSEDLSSTFETELSSRNKSKASQEFCGLRPGISILGEHNKVFQYCKFEVFQGANEEDPRRPRTIPESMKCTRLNPSPSDRSTDAFAPDVESNADSGSCHDSSVADFFNNLDSKSEKMQNAFAEYFAQLAICKDLLIKKEKEITTLKTENEVLQRLSNKQSKPDISSKALSPRNESYMVKPKNRVPPNFVKVELLASSSTEHSIGSLIGYITRNAHKNDPFLHGNHIEVCLYIWCCNCD